MSMNEVLRKRNRNVKILISSMLAAILAAFVILVIILVQQNSPFDEKTVTSLDKNVNADVMLDWDLLDLPEIVEGETNLTDIASTGVTDVGDWMFDNSTGVHWGQDGTDVEGCFYHFSSTMTEPDDKGSDLRVTTALGVSLSKDLNITERVTAVVPFAGNKTGGLEMSRYSFIDPEGNSAYAYQRGMANTGQVLIGSVRCADTERLQAITADPDGKTGTGFLNLGVGLKMKDAS